MSHGACRCFGVNVRLAGYHDASRFSEMLPGELIGVNRMRRFISSGEGMAPSRAPISGKEIKPRTEKVLILLEEFLLTQTLMMLSQYSRDLSCFFDPHVGIPTVTGPAE